MEYTNPKFVGPQQIGSLHFSGSSPKKTGTIYVLVKIYMYIRIYVHLYSMYVHVLCVCVCVCVCVFAQSCLILCDPMD